MLVLLGYQQIILNTWLYITINYSLAIRGREYSNVLISLLIYLAIKVGLSRRTDMRVRSYETLLGKVSQLNR